jgi:hypothetical protein
MSEAKSQRLGAAAGLGFVVCLVVGGSITGSPPTLAASAATITHYYATHHSSLLVAAILVAVGATFFVGWAAALGSALRRGGAAGEAGMVLGGAAAAMALLVASQAIDAGLAQAARGSVDPGFMRGGFMLSNYPGHLGLWFAAGAAVATALVSGRIFPTWYAWLSGVAAVLAALGGISLRATGFFGASGGGMLIITRVVLAIWVLAGSGLLWRALPEESSGPMAPP